MNLTVAIICAFFGGFSAACAYFSRYNLKIMRQFIMEWQKERAYEVERAAIQARIDLLGRPAFETPQESETQK